MTSGKKGSNPPRIFVCEYCGQSFEKVVYPSQNKPQFCSYICHNRYLAAQKKLKPSICPMCGKTFEPTQARIKCCSRKCADRARQNIDWTNEEKEIIASRYPHEGPDNLAQEFNTDIDTIRRVAYRLNLTMTDEALKRRVWDPLSKRMKENNPMFDPKVRAKVAKYWREHPDERLKIALKATSIRDKINPSGLERKLQAILDNFSIEYEPSAIIKPKFVVDIKIGNLIIQADGDYWHGHPRFRPLTEQQKAQQRRDKAQDTYLHKCGYTVIRIWESDMSSNLVQSILTEYDII